MMNVGCQCGITHKSGAQSVFVCVSVLNAMAQNICIYSSACVCKRYSSAPVIKRRDGLQISPTATTKQTRKKRNAHCGLNPLS